MAERFSSPRSGNYIDVPRARPHMGAGAALVARRTGRAAPKSARNRVPERMYELMPPKGPIANPPPGPLEEERMYKLLSVPQFATWGPAQIIPALTRKFDEHVDPARTIIRSLGVTGDGRQNQLDVRSFCVVCINMGVVITPPQARAVLEAKNLPTDGTLTIAEVLRSFRTNLKDEKGMLHDRVAAVQAYREKRAELVHTMPNHMTVENMAHELVRKLEANSSSDQKVLMDIANMLRRSALTGGGISDTRDVNWNFLILLYKRFGMRCSQEQAKKIWAMYGLPESATIADFCERFLGSNRNWVMYDRYEPPAVMPEPNLPTSRVPDRSQSIRLRAPAPALGGAFDLLNLDGEYYDTAAHLPRPPPRSGRSKKAQTPRRAEADARRKQAEAKARDRRVALGAPLPVLPQSARSIEDPEGHLPSPPAQPRPPQVPKLRTLAARQPVPADMLKSPRRLVDKKSPVELNDRLPPELREQLLQAYTHAMNPTVATRTDPPPGPAPVSFRVPWPEHE
mmetsp:Transcript_26397/g.77527  ORF Transcript_26397/g.77527 Transcript_26397/m.77527 type:complete len:511 (-) Transcript_26397:244-1776(-)